MRLHDVTMQIILNPQLRGWFEPYFTTAGGGLTNPWVLKECSEDIIDAWCDKITLFVVCGA